MKVEVSRAQAMSLVDVDYMQYETMEGCRFKVQGALNVGRDRTRVLHVFDADLCVTVCVWSIIPVRTRNLYSANSVRTFHVHPDHQ